MLIRQEFSEKCPLDEMLNPILQAATLLGIGRDLESITAFDSERISAIVDQNLRDYHLTIRGSTNIKLKRWVQKEKSKKRRGSFFDPIDHFFHQEVCQRLQNLPEPHNERTQAFLLFAKDVEKEEQLAFLDAIETITNWDLQRIHDCLELAADHQSKILFLESYQRLGNSEEAEDKFEIFDIFAENISLDQKIQVMEMLSFLSHVKKQKKQLIHFLKNFNEELFFKVLDHLSKLDCERKIIYYMHYAKDQNEQILEDIFTSLEASQNDALLEKRLRASLELSQGLDPSQKVLFIRCLSTIRIDLVDYVHDQFVKNCEKSLESEKRVSFAKGCCAINCSADPEEKFKIYDAFTKKLNIDQKIQLMHALADLKGAKKYKKELINFLKNCNEELFLEAVDHLSKLDCEQKIAYYMHYAKNQKTERMQDIFTSLKASPNDAMMERRLRASLKLSQGLEPYQKIPFICHLSAIRAELFDRVYHLIAANCPMDTENNHRRVFFTESCHKVSNSIHPKEKFDIYEAFSQKLSLSEKIKVLDRLVRLSGAKDYKTSIIIFLKQLDKEKFFIALDHLSNLNCEQKILHYIRHARNQDPETMQDIFTSLEASKLDIMIERRLKASLELRQNLQRSDKVLFIRYLSLVKAELFDHVYKLLAETYPRSTDKKNLLLAIKSSKTPNEALLKAKLFSERESIFTQSQRIYFAIALERITFNAFFQRKVYFFADNLLNMERLDYEDFSESIDKMPCDQFFTERAELYLKLAKGMRRCTRMDLADSISSISGQFIAERLSFSKKMECTSKAPSSEEAPWMMYFLLMLIKLSDLEFRLLMKTVHYAVFNRPSTEKQELELSKIELTRSIYQTVVSDLSKAEKKAISEKFTKEFGKSIEIFDHKITQTALKRPSILKKN